jgi:RNA polymerase sigma-70 factor (sigma-E family)
VTSPIELRLVQAVEDAPQAAPRSTTATTSDPDDFDEFFRLSWPWAFRLAYLLTRDRASGEDIAQQAMIDVFRRWQSIDNPGGYLRRAVVNGVNNWSRGRKVRREKLPLLAAEQPRSAPAAATEANEMIDALAALPHRQRAVIVLRYYLGLSESEIAETLDCRPGTVKSLCSRGLRQLRREQGE